MFPNLLLGALMIGVTVVIHSTGLILITQVAAKAISHVRRHGRRSRLLAIIFVVIGLFAVISVEVWLWAGLYLWIGVLGNLETALYFSTVTFSTVGYGDIVAGQTWRLLAALEGINGFLMIGWSTAYLVAAGTRIGPFRAGEHF